MWIPNKEGRMKYLLLMLLVACDLSERAVVKKSYYFFDKTVCTTFFEHRYGGIRLSNCENGKIYNLHNFSVEKKVEELGLTRINRFYYQVPVDIVK